MIKWESRKPKLIIDDLPDVTVDIWFEETPTTGPGERVHSVRVRNDMSVRFSGNVTSVAKPAGHVSYLGSNDPTKWYIELLVNAMDTWLSRPGQNVALNPNEVHGNTMCDFVLVSAEFFEFSIKNGLSAPASRPYRGENLFPIL